MLGHLGGSPFKFTGEEYLRAALTDSLLIYDFIHVVYDSKIINTTHTIISDLWSQVVVFINGNTI